MLIFYIFNVRSMSLSNCSKFALPDSQRFSNEILSNRLSLSFINFPKSVNGSWSPPENSVLNTRIRKFPRCECRTTWRAFLYLFWFLSPVDDQGGLRMPDFCFEWEALWRHAGISSFISYHCACVEGGFLNVAPARSWHHGLWWPWPCIGTRINGRRQLPLISATTMQSWKSSFPPKPSFQALVAPCWPQDKF
jgi:hypothetical protein